VHVLLLGFGLHLLLHLLLLLLQCRHLLLQLRVLLLQPPRLGADRRRPLGDRRASPPREFLLRLRRA
jgi:hypothetical protein